MSELAVVERGELHGADEEQLVTMTVDGQTFGIPILQVQDIVEPRQITPVPLAPAAIAGVMNLRGRIVTVIDLRQCLGLHEPPQQERKMGVTVEYRNDLYTLVVDSIGDVRHLPKRDREKPPSTLNEKLLQLSSGIYRLKDDLLVVLDVNRVLDAEMLLKTPPVRLRRRPMAANSGTPGKRAAGSRQPGDAVAEDGQRGAGGTPGASGPAAAIARKADKAPAGAPGKAPARPALKVVHGGRSQTGDSPPDPNSLFARIGGDAAIDAAVDGLYARIMGDKTLKPFFDGVDMDKQSFMMRMFLTTAFGGATGYSGRSLRDAHRHLVAKKGLGTEHFDAVAYHLDATLRDLGVPEDQALEVMALVAGTRDDVLGL